MYDMSDMSDSLTLILALTLTVTQSYQRKTLLFIAAQTTRFYVVEKKVILSNKTKFS